MQRNTFAWVPCETVSDGTKVCITKPGGKTFRDFQVWAVMPDGKAWRPSHGKIGKDLKAKCNQDTAAGREVIKALKRVYGGEEPDAVLRDLSSEAKHLRGHSAEFILKIYKWIFAQEDCNYPPPRYQGRSMVMDHFDELSQPQA